jgi:hypothetical protein
MSVKNKGHEGLWWTDPEHPDENPEDRANYDVAFAKVPKPRAVVPSRDQILARGDRRG